MHRQHIWTERKFLKNQVGASMIEVLVALLLLSFTLLGIAGLLGGTTRFQIGVESRSTTALLFTDLSNRLRSNLPNVPGYDVANSTPAYAYAATWAAQQSAISSVSKDCGPGATSTCSSAERAVFDLWEVRTLARRSLPQGSVLLSGDTTNGITATYMWFDKDHLAGTSPPTLKQSAVCSTTTSQGLLQSCCPVAAAVSTTPGVRCMNLSFVP